MAIVRPFKAIRPSGDLVHKVVSLPYDVMNRKEATTLAKDNPYSFLHISRSEIDLPKEIEPYCKAVYEKARENIEKNLATGVFIEEGTLPYIYIDRG